jgi:hypothetical protein
VQGEKSQRAEGFVELMGASLSLKEKEKTFIISTAAAKDCVFSVESSKLFLEWTTSISVR